MMDLVARYVAAVQRELPESKREEIGRELRANIMDQLDALTDQQGALSEADIGEVLKRMGHPGRVARQFVPPQPLIAIHYMPVYQHTLFLVLGLLFLLQVVQTALVWMSSSDMGIIAYLVAVARGFIEDSLFGFAVITLIFYLMSRQMHEQNDDSDANWQPQQLPDASHGWQVISRQDIFSDLATYLFLLVVIWYPAVMTADSTDSVRIALSDHAHQFLRWVSPLIVLGIVASVWQLRRRLWSRRMLLANIVLNLSFVIVILMLAVFTPLLILDQVQSPGVYDLALLEHSAQVTLIIIALFPLWEAGRDLLRLRQV
jgi:hypothetical protein